MSRQATRADMNSNSASRGDDAMTRFSMMIFRSLRSSEVETNHHSDEAGVTVKNGLKFCHKLTCDHKNREKRDNSIRSRETEQLVNVSINRILSITLKNHRIEMMFNLSRFQFFIFVRVAVVVVVAGSCVCVCALFEVRSAVQSALFGDYFKAMAPHRPEHGKKNVHRCDRQTIEWIGTPMFKWNGIVRIMFIVRKRAHSRMLDGIGGESTRYCVKINSSVRFTARYCVGSYCYNYIFIIMHRFPRSRLTLVSSSRNVKRWGLPPISVFWYCFTCP